MASLVSSSAVASPDSFRKQSAENCRRTFACRTIPAEYVGELSPYPVSPEPTYHRDLSSKKDLQAAHDDRLSNTFLSDVSEELLLVEVESRLTKLDILDRAGPPPPSLARDSVEQRRTTAHRHFSSIANGDDAKSTAHPVGRTSTKSPENHNVTSSTAPVATLSLASIIKTPILTVAIEISSGKHDNVPFFENDTPRDVAVAFVKKHHLPAAKVLEPLTMHFEKILNEHHRSCNSIGPHVHSNEVAPQHATQRGLKDAKSDDQLRTTAAAGKRPTMRKLNPSTAGMASQQAAAEAIRTQGDGIDSIRLKTAPAKNHSGVASRYLSPAPKRAPPPPPPTFSHSPAISRGSQKLVDEKESNSGHQPAFERLFKLTTQIPLPESTYQADQKHTMRSNSATRPSPARVASPTAAGSRLHQQAAMQKEKMRALAESERRRAEAKEMEGVTFRPNTNRSSSVANRYRDPYCGATPLRKAKPMSTEQILLQEKCTFHPAVNKPHSAVPTESGKGQPSPQSDSHEKSESFVRDATHRATAPSPSRKLSYAASQEEIRKKAEAFRQLRKPTAVSHRANSAKPSTKRSGEEPKVDPPTDDSLAAHKKKKWMDVVQRLMDSQEQYKSNLDSRKRYLESVDPVTGLPLFKPFLGR